MTTFFDTLPKSFTDVPVNGDKIATTEFLEAAEGLLTLFDVLGSAAFKPVKNDMGGNIKVSLLSFVCPPPSVPLGPLTLLSIVCMEEGWRGYVQDELGGSVKTRSLTQITENP